MGDYMKKLPLLLLSTALVLPFNINANYDSENKITDEKESFHSDNEKINYSMGVDFGKRLNQIDFEFNKEFFLKGVEHGKNPSQAIMTEEQVWQTMKQFQETAAKMFREKQVLLAKENLEKGNTFLEQNKQQEDITILESGLQYRIIKTGTGPTPTEKDTVTIHVVGKMLDGKEFNNTYKKDQPLKIHFNNVMKGWKEALLQMPSGSKWEVFLPPQLAFGQHGAKHTIGPNETVIFELELLGVEQPEPSKETESKP